jgi:hypothetical protein
MRIMVNQMNDNTWGNYKGEIKGVRVEGVVPEDPTSVKPPYYHPAEKEFISSMHGIVRKYGKLEDYDDKGIWVGYESRAKNENYSKGIRCENCAHYESEKVCMIVKTAIEPGGYCRFAAIPSEKVTPKTKGL